MNFLIFLLLLISFSSFAFRLEPMSAELEIGNKKQYFNFVIENPSNTPLPIQVTLYKRDMSGTGEDILVETKDIEAFPDQLIVPPAQKRSVKVSYVGSDKLLHEEAYRFIAEQLPLDLNEKKEKQSGLKMLLKYVAAFYVTPKEAKANVQCSLQKRMLSCVNKGNKHQILNIKKVVVRANSQNITLEKDDLKGVVGENILAQKTRHFKLDSKKINDQAYSVSVEFEK